jgi:hypothetical protein
VLALDAASASTGESVCSVLLNISNRQETALDLFFTDKEECGRLSSFVLPSVFRLKQL